jgi:Single-strand binding protein family
MTDASISFAGNLTDQPEVRYTVSGIARAMFRVAVSGRRERERGFDFWVLRDPWGNEFCVLPPEFPELLARRRPWPS